MAFHTPRMPQGIQITGISIIKNNNKKWAKVGVVLKEKRVQGVCGWGELRQSFIEYKINLQLWFKSKQLLYFKFNYTKNKGIL